MQLKKLSFAHLKFNFIFFAQITTATLTLLSALLFVKMLDRAGLLGPNTYQDFEPQLEATLGPPTHFEPLPSLAEVNIEGDQNIFFVESWQPANLMMHLAPRGTCAIEAAAKQNPNHDVFVFFLDVIGRTSDTDVLVKQLQRYSNIHLIGFPLVELARNTSLSGWIEDGFYGDSHFKVAHVSDIARLLILSQYVGTYMDYDMWSLKGLSWLGKNYIVAEAAMLVNNNFINIGGDVLGRQLIQRMLDELPVIWDPTGWTTQGPEMITQVLKELCNTPWTISMTRENCHGFKVLPPANVNPLSFYQRDYFFNEADLEEGKNLIQNATAVHLWSSYTRKRLVSKNRNVLLNFIAKSACPNIYSAVEDSW